MNKLPAGKYWVGDCCYFIDPDIDWSQEFCEPFFNNEKGEPFLIRGILVAASSTMYGDGSYTSNIDFEFGVDAGLIGVIPESLTKINPNSHLLGVLVDFKEDFTVSYEDGTIYIGHIEIYTNDEHLELDPFYNL